MDVAAAFAFLPNGQLPLAADETLLLTKSDVALYDGDAKPEHLRDGTAYVTSHRLLWHCARRLQCYAWGVERITAVEEDNGGVLSFLTRPSPKVALSFAGGARKLRLSFKVDGQREMAASLADARGRVGARAAAAAAAAEAAARAAAAARLEAEQLLLGGPREQLSALAAHQQHARAQAAMASTLTESFSGGLETLMKKFGELQGMVDACLKEGGGGGGGGGGSGGAAAQDAAEDALIGGLLQDMGSVRNPVTREMAPGRDFAPALAREVAAFIAPHLAAAGGLMPLTDVYCTYGRARGLDSISPQDLLEALKVMPRLGGLGLAPRTLPGGLRVLQLDSLSDEAMVARALASLRAAAAEGCPYTSPQLMARHAAAGGMPPGIARLHLDTALRAGALALDTSLAGRRYYANRFSG